MKKTYTLIVMLLLMFAMCTGVLANDDSLDGIRNEAAKELRDGMLDREAEIKINVVVPSGTDVSDFVNSIYEKSFEHTGIGNEGDYLKANTSSVMWSSLLSVNNNKYTIYITFTPEYKTTVEQEKVVDSELKKIYSSMQLNLYSDYEKIYKIYHYVVDYVEYDYENMNNSQYALKYTAYAALMNGKSVCQGYATLLYKMLLDNNIDTRIISGTGNGGNHAWNIVKINGKYYNLDATWDSTLENYDGSEWIYFLVPDNMFSDHKRSSNYLTEDFVSNYPMHNQFFEFGEYIYIYGYPEDVTDLSVGEKACFSVLTTGPVISYQWQWSYDCKNWKNSSAPSAKTNNYSFTTSSGDNNLYVRCIVKAENQTEITNSAKLTLSDKPAIKTQPKSQTVAVSGKAAFAVEASGSGLTYQWQWSYDGSKWNNSGLACAKTKNYSFNTTMGDNNLLVRCIVKNSSGSVITNSAKLTVTNKPMIISQPQAQTVSVSGKASFTVSASGTGLKYQWQWSYDGSKWNNSGISSAKTNNYIFIASTGDDNLLVRCIVSNSNGSVTSGTAKLTVTKKPLITKQPQSILASKGSVASFSITATGSGLTYQWQWSYDGKNWKNSGLSCAKTNTYEFTTSSSDNNLLVRCVIKNSYGTVTSSTVKLTVK